MPAGRPTAPPGCAPAGRPAAAPKVADDQLGAIKRALLQGALDHGFPTDVWTLERVAVVSTG